MLQAAASDLGLHYLLSLSLNIYDKYSRSVISLTETVKTEYKKKKKKKKKKY